MLNDEQQVQLRNTALEKAVRLVMSGHCAPGEAYAVSRNFYDYMAHGVAPTVWNIHEPMIGGD